MTQEGPQETEAPRQAPNVKGVKLRKCPACKNIVGTDSWCCPRCGIDFGAMRWRRFFFWLIVLGVAGFCAWKFWLKDSPLTGQLLERLKG